MNDYQTQQAKPEPDTAESVEAFDPVDETSTSDAASAEAAKSKPEIAEFLQGIGRTIEESLRSLGTRGNVLNVRVDDPSLTAIDSLVAAGIFKTRSEAAAYLIQVGIESKAEIFTQLNETARRINELKEQMKDALRRGSAPASPAPSNPVFDHTTGVQS